MAVVTPFITIVRGPPCRHCQINRNSPCHDLLHLTYTWGPCRSTLENPVENHVRFETASRLYFGCYTPFTQEAIARHHQDDMKNRATLFFKPPKPLFFVKKKEVWGFNKRGTHYTPPKFNSSTLKSYPFTQ